MSDEPDAVFAPFRRALEREVARALGLPPDPIVFPPRSIVWSKEQALALPERQGHTMGPFQAADGQDQPTLYSLCAHEECLTMVLSIGSSIYLVYADEPCPYTLWRSLADASCSPD